MKKKLLISLFILFQINLVSGQTFWFKVPASTYEVAGGAGIETAVELAFCAEHTAPIYLTANSPKGVETFFQPAEVNNSQQVVLSIIADTTIADQTFDISLQASDGVQTETRSIKLIVHESIMGEKIAIAYRDSALSFLSRQQPEFMSEFGDLRQMTWKGYVPYPPFLIVSHFVFLADDWRINVLWHVMIPPYDWKRIFVCNEEQKVYWGVEIDTHGDYKEIPCRLRYYFLQDPTKVKKSDHFTKNQSDQFLSQNYPNPFNPETIISYHLPTDADIEVTIYNLLGEFITTLIEKRQTAGAHHLNWDGKDKTGAPVSSGLYIYTLKIGNQIQSKKMLLLE